ncbi:MAG: RdgB/HAM1 family non-canonical purine NTP pyrophosphatase [Pseudomonadota bacterium]|nr:RdgB/HAM1 family non-canonical purine NTP pyrophosphatase [Pseudomonadota bacterium]MDQ4147441.1 RdgB/HAM1 family non-canonical purine NTP pyrophosphatase [Pseudomonadota bacterium]
MQRIVLASNNAAKAEELRALLVGLPLEIITQAELQMPSVEETAQTFVENAILKARHAATFSGQAAIADDSGLEVDALSSAPGVFSARYAGTDATDAANNSKLLTALRGVPEKQRNARFQCVVVYLRHALDPMPLICTGTWHGRILYAPRGTNGFGYDPLFYVPSHRCASAELPPAIKNRISHRARALRRLTRLLKRNFACNGCV